MKSALGSLAREIRGPVPWDRYLIYVLAVGIALFAILPPWQASIDSVPPTGNLFPLFVVHLAFLVWLASDLVNPGPLHRLAPAAVHAVLGLGLGLPIVLVTRAAQPTSPVFLALGYAWLLVLFTASGVLAYLASHLRRPPLRWAVFAGVFVAVALLSRVEMLDPWMSPIEVLTAILHGRLRGMVMLVAAAYLLATGAALGLALRVDRQRG